MIAYPSSPPMYTAIQQLTAAILKENTRGALYRHVHELHDIFASVTGISASSIPNEAIFLPQGKAVGPVGAAHCLLEVQRTAVFLKGIYKAILHLQKIFPGERINILYAGCGPYATLLTPMATVFSPNDIGFVLLDINEISLTAAKQLYETLQLQEYVTRYVVADATSYTINPADDIHMVISETMLNALQREPQAAVMQHLIPQMRAHAVFIPSGISVSAKLVSVKQEQESFFEGGKKPHRVHLGELCAISNQATEMPGEVTVTIPQDTGDMNRLQLFTNITVFEDEQLDAYDCSLTLPVTLFDICEEHKGLTLRFRYATGNNPRFEYAINDSKKFLRC